MERRRFLATTLAASAAAAGARTRELLAGEDPAGPTGRQFYELRRYHLRSGPQVKLANDYFRDALIPALNSLGIKPVGVFNVAIGPQNPTFVVLMPSPSLETLVNSQFLLEGNSDYVKAAEPFLGAPASAPAYERMESSLMIAFKGKPQLTVPQATAQHAPRIFELRTYESPSDSDHARKIEMFHSGEFDVFEKSGFWQVFYGDTLVGPRLPNLTYMVGFANLAEREKCWAAFGSAPEWKALSGSPRFNFEAIVSSITNLILSPADYSQI